MPALKDTAVRRGGVTARHWYETIRSVAISAAAQINIGFSMDSKGGGRTQIQMEIGPEDFPTLLQMMSIVNRQSAMEAMSAELARQVQTQPGRNAEVARIARTELQKLATAKFMAKPHGEDGRERIVHLGITELITELEKPKPT